MLENQRHSGSHGSSANGSSAGGSGRPQPAHSRSPSDVDSRVHPPPPPPHRGHLPPMYMPPSRIKHSSSLSSASEFTSVSQQFLPHHHHHADRMSLRSMSLGQQVPAGMSASRASFQQALDNPCEYFIDVM